MNDKITKKDVIAFVKMRINRCSDAMSEAYDKADKEAMLRHASAGVELEQVLDLLQAMD